MRRLGVSVISAWVVMMGVVPRICAASEYGPPAPNYGVPILSGYDTDAVSRVLETISSPARRDTLAEDWLLFAKQSINMSRFSLKRTIGRGHR